MKLIDNRIVIEITYRNNEFGDPVADFELKDYAECVIEELEKLKEETLKLFCNTCVYGNKCVDYLKKEKMTKCSHQHEFEEEFEELIWNRISKLKGE